MVSVFLSGLCAYRAAPDVVVRVLCTDGPGEYPVVSLGGDGLPRVHAGDGRTNLNMIDTDFDLVPLEAGSEAALVDGLVVGAISILSDLGAPNFDRAFGDCLRGIADVVGCDGEEAVSLISDRIERGEFASLSANEWLLTFFNGVSDGGS